MEDATALLSATECATSYSSAGVADHYVSESSDRQSDVQTVHADEASPRSSGRAKSGKRSSPRKSSRRTAVPIPPQDEPAADAQMAANGDDAQSDAESPTDRDSTDSAPALANSEPIESVGNTAEVAADQPVAAELNEREPEEISQALPTPERILEALLFSSDTPLSAARLADLIGGVTPAIVNDCVELLNADYAASGRAFRIQAIAGGYQMLTTPVFQPWLAKLDKHRGQNRLGDAALEVLSIIAYKQPIIRAEVESIRGVACGEVMNRLRDMGLIKAVGRAEVVGRPLLYGTTRKFLDAFGLEKLEDLPPLEAIQLKSRPNTEPKADDVKSE